MKKNILIFILPFFLSLFIFNFVQAKNTFFQEGKILFDKKKYVDSKLYFEKDLVYNPKSEKSYLYLAKIFKNQKKESLEENNLNTVLLLNPKNEEAIYLLTLLNIKKSNFSKAENLILTLSTVCKKMCSTNKELKEKLDRSQKSK
jgi:tetratricopeptide (TPR) repeat protein